MSAEGVKWPPRDKEKIVSFLITYDAARCLKVYVALARRRGGEGEGGDWGGIFHRAVKSRSAPHCGLLSSPGAQGLPPPFLAARGEWRARPREIGWVGSLSCAVVRRARVRTSEPSEEEKEVVALLSNGDFLA